ncbi:MAG: hypothetical protein ABWZ25_12100 [Chitinophagaceae bacterium]
MIKNWKNLFVKDENAEPSAKENKTESYSFPITPGQPVSAERQNDPGFHDPVVTEVLQVYENGLDSINMPGYDFYEFYKTVTSAGVPVEQTYSMAFQMAKSLDKTISQGKLLTDAEFYISKINEVHSQYVSQGQQKLNSIEEQKKNEKNSLQKEIDQSGIRLTQLRAELQQLENTLSQKRSALLKVDETHYPLEKSIREKLNANDMARKTSIDKLNMIKDGIQKFVKS